MGGSWVCKGVILGKLWTRRFGAITTLRLGLNCVGGNCGMYARDPYNVNYGYSGFGGSCRSYTVTQLSRVTGQSLCNFTGNIKHDNKVNKANYP